MYTVLVGGLILSLATLFAVTGLIFAQHRVPLELRQSHNVPLGLIYGALYVTFGVIVGFSTYLVLNKYTTSQTTVVNEAGAVRALYYLAGQLHLAGQLPESQRAPIQELLTSYARVVVDEEWPLMREGQHSPRAEALDQQITKGIDGFQPSTSTEQALYSQALQRDYELNQNRSSRLLYAREGLPPILWVVLGLLAVIIVFFAYFVGMESARLHVLAVAALTVGFGFTMFTIIALDQPFEGDLRVSPQAFEMVLNEIEGD